MCRVTVFWWMLLINHFPQLPTWSTISARFFNLTKGMIPRPLLEIISMMSSLLSPVFPHKDLHNVVWKLSYRGDIPWSALQVGRSNLGLITQATFVHPGEAKRAVLVSDLHHRFQEEGANGQGRFWNLDEEGSGVGELVVSGRFVARMD